MTLDEKLKMLRTKAGLSQKAVAERCGLSLATYSAYENGKRKPERNPQNYEKLADLFGCTSAYLKDDGVETEEAAEAAAPAKKRGTRKKKAEAKEEIKEEIKEETKAVRVELQFGGQTLELAALLARAGSLDPDVTDLYVKPEENMVYYVAGERSGSFPLFE